jgi:hypothetical protein
MDSSSTNRDSNYESDSEPRESINNVGHRYAK